MNANTTPGGSIERQDSKAMLADFDLKQSIEDTI